MSVYSLDEPKFTNAKKKKKKKKLNKKIPESTTVDVPVIVLIVAFTINIK